STFTFVTIMATELSGAATSNVVDKFSANENGVSAVNPWTSNATAAQSTAGNYGLGVAFEINLGSQTFTAGRGWAGVATDPGGNLFFEAQNPVSGTSAVSATGNISTTNNADVIAIAVTLKGAAPKITSLSPTVGPPSPVGSSITITGTNFGASQGS